MYVLPKCLKVVRLPGKDHFDRFTGTSKLTDKVSLKIIDPDNQSIWGYLCIDNTERGPGLGGIRMVKDLSLNEIERLARVMTLKNSAACLPYGGAKAGVILNSYELVQNFSIRAELMEMIADCLFELPTYCPAPDMGTNEIDIQIIHNNHSQKL